MLKYVIFDFDGTLVDSEDVFISVFNQLADRHQFKKIENHQIETLRRQSIIERCKALNFPLYKIPFLAKEAYALYKNCSSNMVLFKGIKELLQELKQRGYELAVISSNSEHNIRDFLQKNQISFIKDIFCSNNIFGKDKIIKYFLKVRKLKKSEVIYVGDELRDIVGCKKAGIKVIWVGWGYDVVDMVRQASPDYIVNTPDEILNIVT
jgi:phosphoglycolate phosphatase